jgi:hypothetical protein
MNDLVANVLLSDSADRAQWMKTRPGEQCLIRVSADDNTASIPWLRSYPALATVRHCTFMKEKTSICSSSRGLIAEDEETTSALLPRDSK